MGIERARASYFRRLRAAQQRTNRSASKTCFEKRTFKEVKNCESSSSSSSSSSSIRRAFSRLSWKQNGRVSRKMPFLPMFLRILLSTFLTVSQYNSSRGLLYRNNSSRLSSSSSSRRLDATFRVRETVKKMIYRNAAC